jgi:hypothetical protein
VLHQLLDAREFLPLIYFEFTPKQTAVVLSLYKYQAQPRQEGRLPDLLLSFPPTLHPPDTTHTHTPHKHTHNHRQAAEAEHEEHLAVRLPKPHSIVNHLPPTPYCSTPGFLIICFRTPWFFYELRAPLLPRRSVRPQLPVQQAAVVGGWRTSEDRRQVAGVKSSPAAPHRRKQKGPKY